MRHSSATAALLAAAIGGAGLVPTAAHADTGPPDARAAWIKSCTHKKTEESYPCGRWRLIMRDGRQVTVRDASPTTTDSRGKTVLEPGVFAISADGRVIVYERAGDHRLVVRRAAGGPATPLPRSVRPGTAGNDDLLVALSPTGDKVLIDYDDDPVTLPAQVITVATGATTKLPAKDVMAGFSGDGDEVLATRYLDDNTTAMHAYSLGGGDPARRTPPQVIANALTYALAPDGRTVAAFTSGGTDDRRRPPRVRTYDLESGELSAGADLPLEPGASPHVAWWEGDGRVRAVVSGGDDGDPAVVRVLTVDPATGAARQIDKYAVSKTRYAYVVAGE